MFGRFAGRRPSPAIFISFLALFVALGGTAYAATGGTFILGHANSANAASSLTSTVASAPALSVKNTAGQPAAKFTSNAGVAPFQVSNGTKITNLNADKLDGVDASALAKGQNVSILANRLVLANGFPTSPTLLTLPGFGTLSVSCPSSPFVAQMTFTNTTAGSVDVWRNYGGTQIGGILSPNGFYVVANYDPTSGSQNGTTMELGHGNNPGARQTASVTLNVFRSADDAPCGFQAMATLWTTP